MKHKSLNLQKTMKKLSLILFLSTKPKGERLWSCMSRGCAREGKVTEWKSEHPETKSALCKKLREPIPASLEERSDHCEACGTI
mmetsp:Transcript_15566/g.25226  ORF Transcript_15566/g.25226 Transcript_15566/m.25226 type:complete len:84 (-) Transcript_15566:41-292(-)